MKVTVQELHKQYDLFDNIKLYLVHQYDKKSKTWQFNHYQCTHCGNNMKYATSITKHPQVCKELNKVLTRTKEQPNIMLADRVTPWTPLYAEYTNISN